MTNTHAAALVVAAAWTAVVATVATETRARQATIRRNQPAGGHAGPTGPGHPSLRRPGGAEHRRGGGRADLPALAPARPSPVAALGRTIRRMAEPTVHAGPRSPPDRHPGQPARAGPTRPDTPSDRRVGWAAVAGLALLPVAAPLAPAPLAWVLFAPALAARRAERRLDDSLTDQVPDIVDLLALTTSAGLPVSVALEAIGDRPGGPLGAAIAGAVRQIQRGGTTSDALHDLAAIGAPIRPLVDALAQHDRYGTPLGPALDRVAIESRARRRRRAEEAARRLPVTLLFPLVLTTLPAFVLLTVVPLLAGSLSALSP